MFLPEVVRLGQHKEALCILHQPWLHCIYFLYLHSVTKSETLRTMSVSNAVCKSCDCPIKVLLASLQSLHKHLAKTAHCECCSTVIHYNTCLNHFKGHELRQATTSQLIPGSVQAPCIAAEWYLRQLCSEPVDRQHAPTQLGAADFACDQVALWLGLFMQYTD